MPETVARAERMLLVALACLAASRSARAQSMTPEALRAKLHEYRSAHDVAIVRELSRFLAIPNLASDKANIRRNAEHLLGMMTARGIAARLARVAERCAARGVRRAARARRDATIVFYAHYDGQPVDTTQWTTPPWQPGAARQGRSMPADRSFRFRAPRDRSRASGGCTPVRRATTRRRSWRCSSRSTRSKRRVSRGRSTSSSSSRARRRPGRAICANCSGKERGAAAAPTPGCSATGRCTSRAGNRSSSACAGSPASS